MADRYEITILAPRVRAGQPRERIDGVEIHRFPYFPRRWEGLAEGAILPNLQTQRWRWVEAPLLVGSFWWHAFRLAIRTRPQVVHAHWAIPAGLVALTLKATMRLPYVLTVHGGDAYALRAFPFRWVKRRVMKGAHTVAPVSRDLVDALEVSGDPSRLPVVPMGVDVDAIRDAIKERSPVAGRFVFVGRLVEKKGVDVLIRALADVPDATLVIVGDGPDRPALEALAGDLGLLHRVRFTGRAPRVSVMDELREAYALVIPSKVAQGGDQEGTPVVMAEGMAAGVPVVASRLGGLAEHIDSGLTGLLVTPGSVTDLARALSEAIADPLALRAYQERASAFVRDTLDIRVTTLRYERILESAICASADPRGRKR